MALLEARGLKRTRDNHLVLSAPYLDFEARSVTAVCGPNGAGKSTLLNILALLDYPDEGTVCFDGRARASHGDWFAARREITLVEQHPYAFPTTVFANAAYGLKMRGVSRPEIRERVHNALARVGLDGFEKRRARTLSGGEVQRLALARAIASSPRALILDEPTAHVDAARVREVEKVISDLRQGQGTTIILATHSHEQALRLADRVIHLHDGAVRDSDGRIVDARLGPEGVLELKAGAWTGPDQVRVLALESAGETVIVRLDHQAILARVSLDQVRQLRPCPGDLLKIKALS